MDPALVRRRYETAQRIGLGKTDHCGRAVVTDLHFLLFHVRGAEHLVQLRLRTKSKGRSLLDLLERTANGFRGFG